MNPQLLAKFKELLAAVHVGAGREQLEVAVLPWIAAEHAQEANAIY